MAIFLFLIYYYLLYLQKLMRLKDSIPESQKMITLLQEPQVLAKKRPKQKITVMEGGKKRVCSGAQITWNLAFIFYKVALPFYKEIL